MISCRINETTVSRLHLRSSFESIHASRFSPRTWRMRTRVTRPNQSLKSLMKVTSRRKKKLSINLSHYTRERASSLVLRARNWMLWANWWSFELVSQPANSIHVIVNSPRSVIKSLMEINKRTSFFFHRACHDLKITQCVCPFNNLTGKMILEK